MARRKYTHKYRSDFENSIAKDLEKRGIDFKYESYSLDYWLKKPRSRCTSCGANSVEEKHSYTPDFMIGDLVIEAKGKFTARNRKTLLAIKEQYPDLNIRMVFMRDNWLTKNHSTKYSQWCEQHNIPYAFGKVPASWV